MAQDQLLPLSAEQMQLLVEALAGQAYAVVTDNPTIGGCWDADRIQLRRFGIEPLPELLSTTAGNAARSLPLENEPLPSWDELVAESALFPEREAVTVMVPAAAPRLMARRGRVFRGCGSRTAGACG